MSIKYRFKAYSELLEHYRTIFSHHWKNRHTFDTMLNETEAEFLPAALSLQEKPVSPTARLVAKVLILIIVSSLFWAIIGKMDIIVNGSGKIIPSSRTKTIASVDVASVKALYVEEGKSVHKGDVLVELDSGMLKAERDKVSGDETEALLQIARAKGLVNAIATGTIPRINVPKSIPNDKLKEAQLDLLGQYRDYKAKLEQLEGEIVRYEQALPLVIQQEHDYKELETNHDVSTHAWLEKQKARIDLEGSLADAKNRKAALIANSKRTAYDSAVEGDKIAAEAKQDTVRFDEHIKLLRLKAPVDGTVQQLSVHTVGGVVPAAQPLMEIVPKEHKVEVEAFLENKDIGFIEEDQHVEVKIDAFEYTKYGTVPGKVSHVSRDAIQDDKKGLIYSVKVLLHRSLMHVNGKDFPLTPGMSVNIEIKTGERRIIEYVLSPLLQHQRESLNER